MTADYAASSSIRDPYTSPPKSECLLRDTQLKVVVRALCKSDLCAQLLHLWKRQIAGQAKTETIRPPQVI